MIQEEHIATVVANLVAANEWSWEFTIDKWERQTAGRGIMTDMLRMATGEKKSRAIESRWYAPIAAVFNIPISFLYVLLDDDPRLEQMKQLILQYSRAFSHGRVFS